MIYIVLRVTLFKPPVHTLMQHLVLCGMLDVKYK